MAIIKPTITMGEILILDQSFNDQFEINEMEAMEIRIRKMMNDKETIAELLPSLNEYMRMKSKLGLCLQLLLDSANIVTDVKSCILDGKLFKAYKNFIKYEKCRNDLLEFTDNKSDEQAFIIGHFNDVELMAKQISDVIHQTLTGTTRNSVNSTDNNDNDNDCNGDNMLQQIRKIIEYDARLDADNEVRKGKGQISFLNRPRNWKSFCTIILANPAQIGIQESFAKQLLDSLINIDNDNSSSDKSNIKNFRIEHDTAYYEELLAMRKYFQQTLICEANFHQIFVKFLKIDDIIAQTTNYLSNSNLFAAIEKLLNAESIRYHLLVFAKSHNEFDSINKLLKPYYESIEQIYDKFINEAKYYCIRSIDIIRGKNSEPKKQLEIILRAIEIDEKIDQLYENNQFKIANRPHCWRKMLFEIVEERVQQRVEAFQIEDRKLNQNWVTRNLEICRLYIVEDLYAAKHFLRIFSKEHQLYNNFIISYHNGIAKKISELAKGELNKRELIQLLSWIRQYPGEHMLGMAFLEIDAISLIRDKPLIERNELMRLFEIFIEIIKSETAKWALKTVKQEFANIDELRSNIMEDEYGYYYTHLSHILYSIVNDQMTLACEISDEIVPRILNECLNEYIRLICPHLEGSINELKNKGMYQKEQNDEYIKIMITIANNLDMFADSIDKLKKYIEGMRNESLKWNEIQNQKRISIISQSSNDTSSISKQKQKCFNRKMQGAIHGAMNALRDIPATLANITPSSSENALNEQSDNFDKQLNDESEVEIELEDEEPLEAAWESIEILKKRFNEMLRTVMNTLCDEICNDLYNCFEQLLTKQWMKDSNIIGTICETIKDYENDYMHLRRDIHIEIFRFIEFKIVAEYLNAIASRKLTCTEYQKRCAIAKCLQNDIEIINVTFNTLFAQFNYTNKTRNLTNVLYSIAEFITLRDKDMLLLEIASLLRKYPEMTEEFLFTLTDIRDDVTSSESRALTEDCMKMIGKKENDPILTRLFQMAKGERKTAQMIKDVVPRIRRRVKLTIANQ
uniref:Exocyst complex component Sec6 n=6 Tax=Wuchereria bancrofti TaxID=6293 RepID=A0AAF5RWI3_WUCBA